MLAGIFAVITYISQHRTAGTLSPTQYGFWHIPLVLSHNIIFYLYKMILPVKLSSHYPFPNPLNLSSVPVLAGVVGTCVLIPLLFISLRWTRAALTSWLIFLATIFPTMGVVGFTTVIASDKFAYLPSVGLLMVMAAFLIWLSEKKRIRTAAVVIVLMLAGAEAAATQRYLTHWVNTESLYSYMLKISPNSPTLHNNIGVFYYRSGNIDGAVEEWSKSIELSPDYADALNNLAWILATNESAAKKYKGPEAVLLAEKACELTGYKDAAMMDTLAAAYAKLGRFDEAAALIQAGMQIAVKSERKEMAEQMSKRLELYKKKQVFHER